MEKNTNEPKGKSVKICMTAEEDVCFTQFLKDKGMTKQGYLRNLVIADLKKNKYL